MPTQPARPGIISGYGLLAQHLLPDDTWICHTVLNISLCALFGATLLPTRKPILRFEIDARADAVSYRVINAGPGLPPLMAAAWSARRKGR